MQTVKLELDEPFAERIERLKHELALALRWDRPSILLTVYASEFVRADAEAALEAWLREQGQTVAQVRVTGPDNPSADVPRFLHEWPDRERTVFFVSGLGWGAPTTWSSLNVRREYLVEGRIRAVFWLTEGEAAALPRLAPDFWVFRHRAVEFIEPPEMGRAIQQASELAWVGFERQLPPEERRARIAFRERLLSELPDVPETAAARAELHLTLGGLYSFGREHETALEHCQTALNLAERSENTRLQAMSLNGLGNVYSNLGRHEEAITVYQRAIELDPNYTYPHNGLGIVYRVLDQHEEAIAACRRAIELDPNYAAPYNGLGNIHSDLGQHEEAIAAYQCAIELDPNTAGCHYGLGTVYRDLGQHEEAIAAHQRAIELDPNFAYPHNGLGNVYRDLGRHEEAIAAFQRAIELDPNFAAPHNNLGLVYHGLSRYEEAIAAHQHAIELDPNFAAPHNNLGNVYRTLGRYEEAIAAYQCAIELDPNSVYPYRGLSNVYHNLGRHKEAIAAYQRAIELNPNDVYPHYNLAQLETVRGNANAALEHLARAIALDPRRREYAREAVDFESIRDDPRFRKLVGENQ